MTTPTRAAILLVLPQARLRDIYEKRGEREGFTIESSPSLLDAERKAVSFRPAMVVIDADLIDDPAAFMQRVKSLPSLTKSRMIVVAPKLSAEKVRAFTASGIKDVVLTLHHHPTDLFKYLKSTSTV